MKSSLVLFVFITLIKKTIAPCTVPPNASGCTTYNLSSNVPFSANVSYCACSACSSGLAIDNLTIACCNSASVVGCFSCLGSAAGDCLSCLAGYLLTGTTCTPCYSFIANCSICPSNTSCSTCFQTHYVDGGNCSPCNIPLLNCQNCISNTSCLSCNNTNLAPNATGQCDICSNVLSNCSTCSSNVFCLTCNNTSVVVKSGSCVTCDVAITGCDICTSAYFCTSCLSGYTITGPICASCSIMLNCGTCSSTTVCTSCANPTFGIQAGVCVLCSTLIQNCTTCSSNTTCTGCLNGSYALRNGQCPVCNAVVGWCMNCASNTSCITCHAWTFMRPNATCYPCVNHISYCKTCFYNASTSPGITCTQCDEYHALDNATGYCYSCQTAMAGCSYCFSSPITCYECLNDTLAVNTTTTPHQCQPCSSTLPNCARCLNMNECIECDPITYSYLQIQNIYANTSIWYGSYFVSPFTGVSGICILCNLTFQLCASCNVSHCLACIPNNNTITVVNTGNITICNYCLNVLVGCARCISPNDCLQCRNSMYHLVTINLTIHICKLCCDLISRCLTCSSPTVCTTCSIGFVVDGGCSNVPGCALVSQTFNGTSRCLRCKTPQFYPSVVAGSCVCQRGHIAGSYCTEIIGCTTIHRNGTVDTCTSCDSTLNFLNFNGQCQCLTNFELVIDRCEEFCGDGFVINQECDDGNKLDLDGCSPICRVENKYICRGGSATTLSICKLVAKINLTLVEARKQLNRNRLIVVISINPPTRLIQFVNLTTNFHFTSTDLLQLVQIDATHEFITAKFDYFQDIPEILATMWIDLNTTHFVQPRVKTSFILRATIGQPLYYDPWAGIDYSYIEDIMIYFSLSAIAVSVLCTVSYKMIGVETIHTFQLTFLGMLFSRRYATFFNNFEELFFTLGQSSPLFQTQSTIVPYKLASLKYSPMFEGNLIIVASALVLAFIVKSLVSLLKKIWKRKIDILREQSRQQKMRQMDVISKVYRTITDNILLPISLSFYFHFTISFVCESYLSEHNEHSDSAEYMRLAIKFILSFVLFYTLATELRKAFTLPALHLLNVNTRMAIYNQSKQPCQPALKYVPIYIATTLWQGLLILAYLLLNLPFYIEVNLVLSIIKLAVLVKTRPYQMAIHNWGICYNTAVLVFVFVWLILEEFYLLSPPATKICANALLGGLVGVLAMSGVRAICNSWVNFKGQELNIPNTPKQEKNSKEQKLLDQKKRNPNKYNNRRREMIETDKKNEKNQQLEAIILNYRQNFSKRAKMPLQMNYSKTKL